MTLQSHTGPAVNPGASLLATTPDGFGHRGAFSPPNAKPVTYQGITYPSRAALARALGMSSSHISFVVKQGRMDTLGRGRAVGLATMHKVHRNACGAHGWQWKTQKDAAKALGVIPQTVCSALNRGRFGNLVMRRLGAKNA